MLSSIREIFKYRELWASLTRKELKVKYRGSVLGFFWSLLNPLLTTLVFSFVFSKVLRVGIQDFYIFLLSALLPWNLLSNSVMAGMNSIVSHGGLIRKIYFPREIIPLSIISANVINYLLELLVLFLFLIVARYSFLEMLIYMPLLLLIQIFLTIGVTFFFCSLNVFFRDIQHLATIFMMIWFYATPIIYPVAMVPREFVKFYILNPMTSMIESYRSIFYYPKFGEFQFYNFLQRPGTYYFLLGVFMSLVIFLIGYYLFKKLEPRFAEEV